VARDEEFKRTLKTREKVIVNCEAVKRDIEKYYGKCLSEKVFVLPFATREVDNAEMNSGSRDPYFVIANQFWAHKDHKTGLLAFESLISVFPDLKLFVTGQLFDYRTTDHIGELKEITKRVNHENDYIVFTGLVDTSELQNLVTNATAVVQPSLFEGGRGGGSVPLSLSLGTPAILSDIPPNLELAELEGVSFFEAGNPKALTNAMKAVLDQEPDRMLIKKSTSKMSSMLSNSLEKLLS
jgi:glycosyltransferase involved in cell wall biosynthesis